MDIYITVEQFIFFVLMLALGAMFINGVHITTRGETITAPDGSKKDRNDMIFYPVYKWIMQERGYYTIRYKGDQLMKKITDMTKPLFGGKLMLPQNEAGFVPWIDEKDRLYIQDYAWIQGGMKGENRAMDLFEAFKINFKKFMEDNDLEVKNMQTEEGTVYFELHEKYPIYKFSKYIRKPTLQCIKCMASFWGTVIFWPTFLSVFSFEWFAVPLWIVYCFSLTWINVYLYNKVK